MKIVLASHNKGKIQEVTDILAPFGIEVEPIPEDFPEIWKELYSVRRIRKRQEFLYRISVP